MDTNPDAMGGTFSSAVVPDLGPGPGDPGWTGYGTGDYSGGYTGVGDRVYWGLYDDNSWRVNNPKMGPVHVGPGGLIQQAASSTGDTILLPPSQTTSVAAPASSTGETILGVGSDQSAVVAAGDQIHPGWAQDFEGSSVDINAALPSEVQAGSTIGGTDVTVPIVHEPGSTVTTDASSGAAGEVFSRTGLHPWAATSEAGHIGGDDVISGSGSGQGGAVEMQPLGPDVGVDSTVYDGDSYHGISDVVEEHPGWSGQDAPGGDLGGDLPGDIELADLGGDDDLLGLGDGSEMEGKASMVDEESGFGETGPSLPGSAVDSQPGLLAGDELIGGDTPMGPFVEDSTGASSSASRSIRAYRRVCSRTATRCSSTTCPTRAS